MRRGLSRVARRWKREGPGLGEWLKQEEFALHSGRIGGATRPAAVGASPLVIQREGRRASNSFMVYVRANMENPRWVTEVVAGEKRERRQP